MASGGVRVNYHFKQYAIGLTLLGLLSACSQTTTGEVFPESDNFNSAASSCSGQAIPTRFIVQWKDGRFTSERAANKDEFIKNFVEPNLQDIAHVEYDRMMQFNHGQESRSPASLQSMAVANNWGALAIHADQAWSAGIKGSYTSNNQTQFIKVAVVDSYVEYSHAQLSANIALNTADPVDGIDNDNNGVVDDYYGANFSGSSYAVGNEHGTHVAGIIAASEINGVTFKGVAPEAQIIPSVFISTDGAGLISDAILAMQYARDRGAKIINASWGGAPCVGSLTNAFQEMKDSGILLAVAAGNEGDNVDTTPSYPAAYNADNQITVAAMNVSGVMPIWSNYGQHSSGSTVHIVAPGVSIYSTVPAGDGTYGSLDGTSMATPFVAGVAALLWSAEPSATYAQIKSAIESGITGSGYPVSTGGKLDMKNALCNLNPQHAICQ